MPGGLAASRIALNADNMATHPYYPQGIVLPGKIFAENKLPVTTLISVFAAGLGMIVALMLLIARNVNPELSFAEVGLVLWFTICESACQTNRTNWLFQRVQYICSSRASSSSTIRELQACKRSLHNFGKNMRCLIQDICSQTHWFCAVWTTFSDFAFHCMPLRLFWFDCPEFCMAQTNADCQLVVETWTVVRFPSYTQLCASSWQFQIIWGPLCFLAAFFIITSSPYRHPTQALVSTGHLYGNLIYLSTSLYEDVYLGKKYYRPEPYYFWIYFVLMNLPWIVVPASECFISERLRHG